MNNLRVHFFILVFGIMLFVTGCGPTLEEIKAQRQAALASQRAAQEQAEAQRQVEEARRQAEEARLAKIRVIETAGDEAAKQGSWGKALENYQEALKNIPGSVYLRLRKGKRLNLTREDEKSK